MGVERFFSSLKRDYNFINDVKPNEKIDCEHLLIDFNSIVHVISQFLLAKQNYDSKDSFEELLIKEVERYIITLLKNVFNSKMIYTITICVDGVPTMSKIYEQKKRRYMGDLLSHLSNKLGQSEGFSWSRNNISPGTKFMNKLMDHLNSKIFEENIFDTCHSLKHITISGIDVVGEGEIKILHYIEKLIKTKYKNDKYVVYSPDSDVIILLLMTNINVSMLRYDQQKSTEDEYMYSIVDINKFKDILYKYISDMTNKKLDKMRVIMDIVFILTVFGDDFLPKLETVRVNTDINLLIKHYVVIVIKYDYILNLNNSKYQINTDIFYQFLLLLQKKEDSFLRRNARYHISSNYNRIVSDIVGYNMNQLRDYIVEYLWKFIYFNKPADITISPINAHMHISIDKLEEYMDKPEEHLNISSFTHMDFKNTMVWNKMLTLISDYYIETLNCIDGVKMKNVGIYTNECFYINQLPTQLLKDIIVYFYKTYELPITISLKTSHDKLMLNKYYSTDNPHAFKLKTLLQQNRDNNKKGIIEQYLIDHKLDKYYKIFNPKDQFYYDIYFKANSYTDMIPYSTYYTNHFPHTKLDTIVSDYMGGFNWIVSYYHNTNAEYKDIDMTWYYRHNRSPLLKDIIKHYDMFYKLLYTKMNIKFKKIEDYMTPLEHFMFVSPFNIQKDTDYLIEHMDKMIDYKMNNIKLLVRFILSNKKYYYQLNNIYNNMGTKRLVDCSGSIFISKCHLLFMENYVDMRQFVSDFRKSVIIL